MSEKPLIFRFATPRTQSDPELEGRYCREQSVWVVDTVDGEKPLVEVAPTALSETQTKTMTEVEADDDDLGRGALMETSTVTKVRQESDDRDASIDLAEIQTKTEVEQERDDQVDSVI